MKKRMLSLCLVILIFSTVLVAPLTAGAEDTKYIVMVLDESGPVTFSSGGRRIYTADSSVSYVKEAAKKFVESTLSSNENQQIAIVSYHKESFLQHSFSNDVSSLIYSIDNMYAHEKNETNLTAGLEAAHKLLSPLQGEKNVVIFTTGYGNIGASYDDGYYSSSTVGSNWVYAVTDINLYKYANGSHRIADQIKNYAKIYSVGLFQAMEGMPNAGKEIAEFFRLFAKDLASSKDYFYLVEDVDNLNSAFETVAEDIQLNPSIWAKGEITEAKDLGLIPETLEGKDLSKKITRSEFAAVSLELYEALSGKTAASADSPFRDIANNENEDLIKKAYGLNIVAGISATEFSPDAKISREDLAAMLCRAIKKYKFEDWSLATDNDYYLDSEGVKKYADDADISGYAKPSVYYLTKMGILNGVSETHFAPKNTTSEQEAQGYATATREQAIALSLRIFKISELLNVSQADTSWKDAYAKFLKTNQTFDAGPISYKKGKGRFALAYLDGDSIPELLIISQNTDTSLIYTYDGKEVTSFSTYYGGTDVSSYDFKKIKYIEKGSKMLVDWSDSDIINKQLLVKPDFEGEDLLLCFEAAIVNGTYYCNEYDMKRLSEENHTYMDEFSNHEVSEAEYNELLNQYGIADESVFTSITEEDLHYITPDVIDEVLGK